VHAAPAPDIVIALFVVKRRKKCGQGEECERNLVDT